MKNSIKFLNIFKFSSVVTNEFRIRLLSIVIFATFSFSVFAQQPVRRVYATGNTDEFGLVGSISSNNNAKDGDVSTASTISVAIVGSRGQRVQFPSSITNKAVHIKLGSGTGLISLLPTITVQAYNGGDNNGNRVGAAQVIEGSSLLHLLNGTNTYEYIYTPSTTLPYDRVRVTFTAIAIGTASIKFYDAYYEEPASTTIACDTPVDLLSGSTGSLLSGVTTTVIDPGNAINGNEGDFARISTVASAANYSFLTVLYPGTSKAGDSVRVLLEDPSNLLELDLLSGIEIHTYKGNDVVDSKTDASVLHLQLLSGSTKGWISFASEGAFDRVQIRVGGLLNVLGALNVYGVQRVAAGPSITATVSLGVNNSVVTYQNQTLPVITSTSTGNTVLWYEGSNTTALGSSPNTYDLPVSSIATPGNYIYHTAAQRTGCTNISAKVPVNVKVLATPTFTNPGYLASETVYSGTDKSITVTDGQVGSSYSFSGVSVLGLTNAGLTLQTNGSITGTPAGTFAEEGTTLNFTANIIDVTLGNIPVLTARSFSVVVYPKLKLAGGAFPQADIVLEVYEKNISEVSSGVATGGKGAANFVYSLTAPSQRTMALTFSMDTDGTLRTNPSEGTVGDNDFTVYVTDGLQVASSTYSLKIVSGSLPVKLTNFTVKKEGSTAQLTWATTEEVNSESFDVERSSNGKQWNKIGSKKSSGESASIIRYNFADTNPANGENLYRLKMIDRDGTFAYSGIESATFNRESISLYPNPVAGSEPLSIQVGDWSNVKTVKVISAAGKVVFESAEKTLSSISTNQFTAGLYVVQITHKNGQVVTSRFVKM